MGIEGGSSNNEVQYQEINQSNNEQIEQNQAVHQRSGEELEGNSTIDNEGERKQIEGKDDATESNEDESSKLDSEDSIENDHNQVQPTEGEGNTPEQQQLDNQDSIESDSSQDGMGDDNQDIIDFLDSDESIEDDAYSVNEDDTETNEPQDSLDQDDAIDSDDEPSNKEDDSESTDGDSLDNDDSIEDGDDGDKPGESDKVDDGNKSGESDIRPLDIENSPLPKETVEFIRDIDKGSRPNPETYMPQEMIDDHLDKFKDGGSFVMTQDQYDMFVDGKDSIGCPDNSQFMTTKEHMDKIVSESGGDVGAFEKSLGFDPGYFENGGGMVRIDVDNPLDLNGRIPSENEVGANDRWIPGGYTDGVNGGSPEIVTDKIPNDDMHRTITFGL